MNFSIKTRSFPKALPASDWAEVKCASKSQAISTNRMPLPPPPATAFIKTG